MGNIHYSAPDESKILEFVKRSLHRHAECRGGDDVYTQAEIVYGFAEFLKVILRIEAKRRNLTAISNGCTVLSDKKTDDEVLEAPRRPGHSTNPSSATTSDRLYHVGGLSATD